MISPLSCVYDFANLDREKKMDGLRYRIFGNQLRSISAEIVVDRSSRVLVFRDHSADCPPSYILEVKVIAARLRKEISLNQDSTAELVVATDNHSVCCSGFVLMRSHRITLVFDRPKERSRRS